MWRLRDVGMIREIKGLTKILKDGSERRRRFAIEHLFRMLIFN
jgi:hypothetical protein